MSMTQNVSARTRWQVGDQGFRWPGGQAKFLEDLPGDQLEVCIDLPRKSGSPDSLLMPFGGLLSPLKLDLSGKFGELKLFVQGN